MFRKRKRRAREGLRNGAAFGTTELQILRSLPGLDARFLFYLTISAVYRRIGEAEMYGAGGQKRVPSDFNKDFRTPMPPLDEQGAIADFLDTHTAKIDALVAKKLELIERLQEKRSALISRTVTHGLPPGAARVAGLDPHPKLRFSGIDWLGTVPEHWEIVPVKFIARVGNGSTPRRDNADYWFDGVYPWLNSSVVNQEEVISASELVTDVALQECHLPIVVPPAVLIGITGEGKTRGMATTLGIEATINQHLAYIKPSWPTLDVRYLRRVMDHAYSYLRSESEGGGSTKGAITCQQLTAMRLPFPPIEEQRAIASYLARETAATDQMIAKVDTALERLQEYRAALITAAVTGKIDVRNCAVA